LSFCPSHISKTPGTNFTKLSEHVTYHFGSVLLGFVGGVLFSHN